MSMHTYVHTPVYVYCVCACVYIRVKWPGQSWGCQADSVRGEQHLLSRPPRPLFFPLAEPQFEPQRVHSVQVVSEQPFVSDKTQVLIQLQGWFVGDFSLQYNLWTRRWPYQYVVVDMNRLTGPYKVYFYFRTWYKRCVWLLWNICGP